MSNTLQTFKPLPYTHAAFQLLKSGWTMPDGLDIPCFTDGDGLELTAKLDLAEQALGRVEGRIAGSGSDAEQLVLHNMFRLPLLELRQRLTDEVRENMPREIIPYDDARRIVEEILYAAILQRTGNKHLPVNVIDSFDDEVQFVTDCVLNSEGQDHDTHGISRIPDYAQAVLDGKINTRGKVVCVKDVYGKMCFKGDGTFGQVAAQIALQNGLDRMRNLPPGSVMAVTVRKAYHAGRLEYFERQAGENDCSCFAMLNVGGKRTGPINTARACYGTNPLAFEVPIGNGEVWVFDTASTTRPEGHVNVSRQNGFKLQVGILETVEGFSTTDPAELYRTDGKAALLLPMGADHDRYKGAGIAQGIELAVDAISERQPGEETLLKNNNLVLFLCKGDEDVFRGVRERVELIESSPTVPGKSIRRPGAHGLEQLRRAKEEGLRVAAKTWKEVSDLHGQLCGKA
ncbi:MAG: hypothetical protein A3B68_08165 [Candidatus Melainabacteria bacterium RIFCSPHIGHO2_02_FULL_34_12]|nr:MAG: hypothetical protein A3B68_08165 [Candidatus Melainabacteria bacterium RIFCSPHIGHO2_02_FULL_34_12]